MDSKSPPSTVPVRIQTAPRSQQTRSFYDAGIFPTTVRSFSGNALNNIASGGAQGATSPAVGSSGLDITVMDDDIVGLPSSGFQIPKRPAPARPHNLLVETSNDSVPPSSAGKRPSSPDGLSMISPSYQSGRVGASTQPHPATVSFNGSDVASSTFSKSRPIQMEKVVSSRSPITPIEDISELQAGNPSTLLRQKHEITGRMTLSRKHDQPTTPNTMSFRFNTDTFPSSSHGAPGTQSSFSNDRSHNIPPTESFSASGAASKPQKILLPSDYQYPLLKEPTTPALSSVLKNSTNEISLRPGFSDVVTQYLKSQENVDSDIVPMVNGQNTESQVPSFYQPPPELARSENKAGVNLSSKEINILLLHISRIGDIVSLRSLTRSPKLDLNLADDEGRTPLIFSSIGGHDDCVELLLEKGALVHQVDFSGRTPLHWAAQFGKAKVVQKLLRSGADVMVEDYQGKNSFHCAASSSDASVYHILLKFLPDVKGLNGLDDDHMSCLMWAAYHGNYKGAHALLKHKADPYLKDVEGKTALHWTAANKHIQCATVLVSFNPDLLNLRDRYGRTALHLSCGEGNIAMVYFLLALDPTIVNERDEIQRTPLHWAASMFIHSEKLSSSHDLVCGKSAILKLLCEFGARLNKKDKHGATPIYYAAQQNFQDCVHILLRKGASVSSRDEYGRHPLIWASIQGHIEVIKMLLQARAEVNAQEDHGLSALHFAAYAGHTACCLYLVRNGADVNINDYKLHTPVFRAAISGHTETVLALISEGANVNAQDLSGRAALHWASSAGHIDVVNILVGYGASIELKDKKGATALHEAAFHGKPDVMVYLLSRGASVNCKDENGVAPIHWAAVNGHINCCRLLLSNGAAVNAMVHDVDRDTALDYAYLNNNFECAQFLMDHGGMMAEELIVKAVITIQKFVRRALSNIKATTDDSDLTQKQPTPHSTSFSSHGQQKVRSSAASYPANFNTTSSIDTHYTASSLPDQGGNREATLQQKVRSPAVSNYPTNFNTTSSFDTQYTTSSMPDQSNPGTDHKPRLSGMDIDRLTGDMRIDTDEQGVDGDEESSSAGSPQPPMLSFPKTKKNSKSPVG